MWGGLSFKVISSLNDLRGAPAIGEIINLFTYLHVREDALELYGFLRKDELEFFEMLISISGIGPKSALGILSVESVDKLKAAIAEGRAELLTKASGVGKKTAERVILELRGKLGREGTAGLVGIMESDQDILEALVNLGYTKYQAKDALSQIDPKIVKVEERIRATLKILKK